MHAQAPSIACRIKFGDLQNLPLIFEIICRLELLQASFLQTGFL